jgi:hypothetical protein
VSDDQPQLSDSIPVVIDAARETLAHLLRLIRPAQADLIDQLCTELARHLDRVLELANERAAHQSAAAVVILLERVEVLELTVGIERAQAREVGGE